MGADLRFAVATLAVVQATFALLVWVLAGPRALAPKRRWVAGIVVGVAGSAMLGGRPWLGEALPDALGMTLAFCSLTLRRRGIEAGWAMRHPLPSAWTVFLLATSGYVVLRLVGVAPGVRLAWPFFWCAVMAAAIAFRAWFARSAAPSERRGLLLVAWGYWGFAALLIALLFIGFGGFDSLEFAVGRFELPVLSFAYVVTILTNVGMIIALRESGGPEEASEQEAHLQRWVARADRRGEL